MKKVLAAMLVVFLLGSFIINVIGSPAFVYTDSEANVSFTVPANWTKKVLLKDREYVDAKFVSTEVDGLTIIYGSTDMWSQMPASERAEYSRSDVNNSILTYADIAETLGTSTSKVKKVTYNGVEYFQATAAVTSTVNGRSVSVTMTTAVYFNNGWMYMFQFSGSSSSKYFSDFESVLNTVVYPPDSSGGNNVGWIVAVVIAVVLAIVVFFVVKKMKTKRCIDFKKENVVLRRDDPTEYCCMCGVKVLSDSEFCHACGVKINREKD